MKRLRGLVVILLISTAVDANKRVADTVHNLSTSGPGQFKSQSVDQVCVFCHTPHKPALGPGLWNRRVSQINQSYQNACLSPRAPQVAHAKFSNTRSRQCT